MDPFVQCFRFIVPTFDSPSSILITALMSAEEPNLPHELDVDGTVMILKAVGKATGVLDDGKATFTLYPVDITDPTEDKAEYVSAPVSPQSMEVILRQFGGSQIS